MHACMHAHTHTHTISSDCLSWNKPYSGSPELFSTKPWLLGFYVSLHFLILARILVSQFSRNPSSLIADHPQYLIVFLITYYPPSESDHLGLPSARILNRNLAVRFSGFPGGSDGKESDCNARDMGSIPGWGRSPGEGNGNPLQYPCLGNPMDIGAWPGYSPWSYKGSDRTEQSMLSHHGQFS